MVTRIWIGSFKANTRCCYSNEVTALDKSVHCLQIWGFVSNMLTFSFQLCVDSQDGGDEVLSQYFSKCSQYNL